ncbi:MAG: HEPN domain-containing protein [Nitrospirota bacterium]
MSRDEERHEALRWLETGREDLEVARILLGQGKYSHACFCGQQAAEKAASLVPR